MRIELNGQNIETQVRTLADLLIEQGFESPCVATALNGDFIARPLRSETRLNDGVKVEVLSPMQGG
ncbi:sulfur carrier protein ThiS [Gluconobacter sp. Dm-62]|uniref:sulfur carrier protein ThiS n=1 Tax=Gluconobacter sp. Dm-62 TaxID=2799804 RepID=UPI001B8C0409|nr:sulfur carrier protein ThiS [Gluconobacter sp. Dm-62]MBS1102833.1 sulfur carrier protein ThiS [Gluconobacter sp. Dm-62]